MSKRERDILEDLFRDKLYNHEVETTPADWEMIARRLPEPKPVVHTFRHRWLYWSAAAVAALVVSSGLFFLADRQPDHPQIVQQTTPAEQPTPEPQPATTVAPAITTTTPAVTQQPATTPPVVAQSRTVSSTTTVPAGNIIPETLPADKTNSITPFVVEQTPVPVTEDKDTTQEVHQPVTASTTTTTILADAQPVVVGKEKTRRWGFGVGGGSMTASATNNFNTLVQHQATFREDEQLIFLNTAARSPEQATNIQHKTPVSFGLSASYYLTDRWAILTGLSYTMLTTEFEQQARYHNEVRRRLHFIGIPISISYKIAEWNSFQLYAAAGFMPELNVAGNNRIRMYIDNELQSTTHESVRIKELFWSVNGRAGVSYPVFRYVNAFAEVGAGYYFDNGSDTETIRSEKPFNVSLNFGLRLGF